MAGGRDFESAAQEAHAGLWRGATVLCRSRSDVEDVVQETLMRAFRSYKSFRGDSSFFTWAYSILVRVASETNRERLRNMPDGYAEASVESLRPIEDVFVHSEEARHVIEAIRRLPERQRQMVTLYFLEYLSYKEIACALDVSIGTVKATLYAAKQSLRATLEPDRGCRR